MANEYATLAELKAMRNITGTSQDVALQAALTRASRAIDRRTGRSGIGFGRTGAPSVRTYSPLGRTVMRPGYSTELLLVDEIADPDTISVTRAGSVLSSFSVAYSPENAAEKGLPVTGLLYSSWYGYSLEVEAEWGWPAVPESITEATLLLANRRYMRKDSPEGTSGWSSDGPVGVSRFDSDIEDLVYPFMLDGFA